MSYSMASTVHRLMIQLTLQRRGQVLPHLHQDLSHPVVVLGSVLPGALGQGTRQQMLGVRQSRKRATSNAVAMVEQRVIALVVEEQTLSLSLSLSLSQKLATLSPPKRQQLGCSNVCPHSAKQTKHICVILQEQMSTLATFVSAILPLPVVLHLSQKQNRRQNRRQSQRLTLNQRQILARISQILGPAS